MPLAVGVRFGSVRIRSLLGVGAMGEVYKAHDTRLERTFAIKVLPPTVAADPDPSKSSGSSRAKSRDERRAPFEREAKTILGLNHATICSLYDVARQRRHSA